MEKILVHELIKTGFSLDEAQKLFEQIDKKVKAHSNLKEKIIIDFNGVKFFTTQFFNNSISKYILTMGPEEFKKIFEIINLSDAGQSTYQHSFENAVSYYNLPAEKRIEQNKIVDENEELE